MLIIFQFFFQHVWLFFVIFLILYAFKYGYDNNFDNPGPWGLPFVGYLPFLNPGLLYRQLTELAAKHGPIYQVRLGQRNALVLTDVGLVSQAFNLPEFAGRPETGLTALLAKGGESQLAFRDGDESWYLHRKIASRALGLFDSYGRQNLESATLSGVDILRKKIRDSLGVAFDSRTSLQGVTMAIMSGLSFGRPVDLGDPFLRKIDSSFQELLSYQGKVELLTFFPLLKWVFRWEIKKCLKSVREFSSFMRRQLGAQKVEKVVENRDIKDFSQALMKVSRDISKTEKLERKVEEEDIRMISVDLFDGGSVTLAENTSWLLLLMATHPQIQDKVQMLLDICVPSNRRPNLEDEIYLPYLRACVLETLRYASNLPFALPHTAMRDIADFQGFRVAKGTLIMANLWALHRDPRVFPEPHRFRPERFLGSDGQIDQNLASNVMAFSVGRRRCVGEMVAKRALFLIFTNLLREFRVELAKTGQEYGNPLEPTAAFSLAPGPHKLIFWPRNNNNRDFM